MKLLVTNDDGIDAEGLAALRRVADQIGDAIVVAPVEAHSGCSHRVTTDRALRIHERGPQAFAVDGTPADCIRVGLHRLAREATCVLSGINHGGNLGVDVFYSGTVAAVREAVLHGVPGIAFSQYKKRHMDIDWNQAAQWLLPVVHQLLAQPWKPGSFWNINLPHLEPGTPAPEVVFCPLEIGPLPLSYLHGDNGLQYNGNYHERPRGTGTDVEVCFSGRIAVTQLVLG